MIIAGIISVLVFTNVISLYLYIKNDVVAQNNIKTYISNEEAFRVQMKAYQESLTEYKVYIKDLEQQIENSVYRITFTNDEEDK